VIAREVLYLGQPADLRVAGIEQAGKLAAE
jgi:hypothetical protein